jgi:DNA-binding MarR family transcriptional regulator
MTAIKMARRGVRLDAAGAACQIVMHMHDVTQSGCACTALRKASRAITRLYDAALAHHGLNTSQFGLLRHIARVGEISLSRLAEGLVMDRTTLYRVLRPVEAAGWVETRAEPKGKSRCARLTAQGQALIARAEADWQACQDDVRRRLGEGAWTQLHAASVAVQELAA